MGLSLAGFPFGGVVLAVAWWFVLFSPWTAPQNSFWLGMTMATGTLLGYSAWVLRREWRPLFRVEVRWIVLGIGSAFALYGLFWVGHALMVALFPEASAFVNAVYTRRAEAPAWLIALLLAVWIGPAEEVFWRGILQRYLQTRLRPIWGLLVATALYTLVHIWAGNPPLLLAAFVAGMAWGALFLWTGSLIPGIISHALWDVLMFVLLPLQ
ncbi:MAG: CPBP family intramembrane glutamic endopeptidase [Chlorobiota bacterium]